MAVSDYTGVNTTTLRAWHNRKILLTDMETTVARAGLAEEQLAAGEQIRSIGKITVISSSRSSRQDVWLQNTLDESERREALREIRIKAALNQVLAGGQRLYTRNDNLSVAVCVVLTQELGLPIEKARAVLGAYRQNVRFLGPLGPLHDGFFRDALRPAGDDLIVTVGGGREVQHDEEGAEDARVVARAMVGDWHYEKVDEQAMASINVNFSAIARHLAERMEASEIGPSFVLEINGDVKLERC